MQTQRDPLEDLTQLRQTVGHLIEDGLGMLTHLPFMPLSRSIPIDVFENRNAYQIDASLPGIDPVDLAVLATETSITIQAPGRPRSERREGTYITQERYLGRRERVVTLAKAIDPAQVTSTYQHGVLTISAPKVSSLKATQIPVQVSKQETAGGSIPTTTR